MTALGVLLRFPTLGGQSYEGDELYTVWLVRMGVHEMVATIPQSESTPHLYYLLAWVWAGIFGTGEVGLRALSALIGTAAVPVAAEIGRVLVSRRAGIVAAALVAVNPLLVWYSQEARAYALLVLLTGLSLLFFAHALKDGRPGALWWWAFASSLALATHYFAFFLVAPEALWLALRARRRRAVLLALSGPALAAAALVPLALHQRSLGNPEREQSLAVRTAQIPKNFLVGFNGPAEVVTAVAAVALVVFALWLLVSRGQGEERRGAALAASLAAAAVGFPLALGLAGADYLDSKNVIGALLPCAVAAAAGFAASRVGLAAAGMLGCLCMALVLSVASDPRYQRLNWRDAARALGPADRDRAIVVTRALSPELLRFYLPGVRAVPERGVLVREVDVIGLATLGRYGAGTPRPPRATSLPPLKGFAPVVVRETATYTLVRLRARAPARVSVTELSRLALEKYPAVLLQPACRG